jgi:DNA-directed RNA polymerase specialized sigma24 family protein
MTQHRNSSDPLRCEPGSDTFWINLYSFLRPLVKRLVLSSGISSWRGQEEDIVEDIVQETITRVLKCMRRAERGEGIPIASPLGLSIVIARNYYEDLRRRDRKLVHITTHDYSSRAHVVPLSHLDSDPAELALNNIFLEWLYVKFSLEAVKFSYKQRSALFVDLANRMDFDAQPTALQKAFLEVGIRLQDYQQPLPKDTVGRSRHASNVSLAYKRAREWARRLITFHSEY